ncbi:uncharacterized protein LOC134676573 [Cydia fagiglandana]|uniref:uncharacterized protein LOC134676573 n=1 Tax=Cydia fagiglandana TaxID=1458189 RepID=UPI002FEE3D19
MEANDLIAKLKADGSANDVHDLDKVYSDYKALLEKLPSKDKGVFSLNVLCILCRNIDKVPSWRDKIDSKALLNLSIDCVRQTRGLEKPERVKVLACVYHIHKFIVRQPSQPPPELVLKLSYMPFEYEQNNLLSEYCKTYWNLLADRLMFIEKFKTGRRAIIKLLPKLIEDIQKIIHMYDSVQFCNTILVFLLKKLHFLYNTEHAKELNKSFGMIFESLSLKKDVKSFKKLTEKEMLELYVKFSDCFYVIAENATKLNFQDSVLTAAVRSCIPFIGHAPELFHCLQTFYLNSFCCILTDNDNPSINETVLNSLIISCETTERLGYLKAMRATYPYINQLLRVFIEYNLTKLTLTDESQETCLKLIILLLDKLKDTEQLLKCDNCKIKSGLHDALRLSFLAKNFVSACLNSKQDVNMILQPYLMIIKKQHIILTDLCRLGCSNHEKCLRKLQTDIHNTAILLNKAENYNSAIQLFDLYLTHEFLHFKTAQDLKNISRALYNKSICELDCRMYERALIDGFLSLVFAQPEGLSSEKYMSLVMDVKAKALKGCDDEELQMMTVLDACNVAIETKLYGNLKPFFGHLEFNTLLHHEFTLYGRLWPSLSPVAGVWRALHYLSSGKRHAWMCAQPPSLDTLYSVILHTPTAVRTIHSAHIAAILSSILDNMARTGDVKVKVTEATLLFLKAEMDLTDTGVKYEWKIKEQFYILSSILDNMARTGDVKVKVTEATLLFLKAEMDLTDTGVKYEWKIKEQSIDPDLVPCCRTLEQEHTVLKPALRGVKIWTEVLSRLDDVPQDFLTSPLLVLRVMLQQLLHVRSVYALQLAHVALRVSQHLQDSVYALQLAHVALRVSQHLQDSVYALQLAHVALRVSQHLQDREAYLEAAGVILSRAYKPSEHLRRILSLSAEWAGRMMEEDRTREAALVFLCDAAIYYHNTKQAAASAKLIRVVQSSLLNDMDSMPIAIGRVLDAQALYGDLSASVNAQRHYLTTQSSLLNDMDSMPIAIGRVLDAQALYGDLSASVNAQRHYLTVGNTAIGRVLDAQALYKDLSASVNAQRHYLTVGNTDAQALYGDLSASVNAQRHYLTVGNTDAQALYGDLSASVNAQRHYLTVGNTAIGRVLDAQALYGDLSASVNAQRHYLTVGNTAIGRVLDAQALYKDLSASVNAQRHYLTVGNTAIGRVLDAQALYGDLSASVNAQRHYLTTQSSLLNDMDSMLIAIGRVLDAQALYGDLSASVNAQRHYLTTQSSLTNDMDSMPIAIGRVLDAQALYGDLSASVNAQRHYLTVGNTESTWCLRQRRSLFLKQSIFSASLRAVSLSRSLRLRRRGRAAAACALASASAEARLALCVAATDPSRCDVARATIDQRLKRIVGLRSNECALQEPIQNDPKTAPLTPQLEAVRDARIPRKHQTSPSIPIEYVAAFKTPEFFDHSTKCECYVCETPSIFILASQLLGLEASVYYRGREFDVAKNYFNGVLENFCNVESKIKAAMRKLREKFEKYVVDIIEKSFEKELFNVELEILIEAAYFELSQKNYAKSDDYIYVRISEILQAADVDGYTKNEIMNLMTASEILRKSDKIPDIVTDIENDLENLKLTPTKDILKTPEAKRSKPPVFNKVVVNKEELPDLKCKIPVLNFDEPEEQIVPKKKINFKIPIPITSKPVLETITPRPRSKVNILVTEPSDEDIDVAMTPQTDKSKVEFFTPSESTPDQFFTPQTSVKTYAKKSLRQNIVKNLEQEFSLKEIPKDSKRLSKTVSLDDTKNKDVKRLSKNISLEGDSKENAKPNIPKPQKIEASKILEPKRGRVETGSLRTLKDRRLKRSTSPGTLPKEDLKDNPRTRLRKPAVKVERDDKK